jgi:hypothetical protein
MNLTTLGAIIKFAVKLEEIIKDFYVKTDDEKLKDLIVQYEKRIKKLKRIRRENTTEMILEPIQDFDSEPFEIELTDDFINIISPDVEKMMFKFYSLAAEKVAFLSEVAHQFENMANDHQRNSDRT